MRTPRRDHRAAVAMADDGPQLLRPIPRRPFNLNLTSATPPDDDDQDSPQPGFGLRDQDFSSAPRFLNAGLTPVESGASISRPQSFLNLTSSTLMGIYSQATGSSNRFIDREEIDTPWGTGAQTPIKRPSVDDATYELMRDRSHIPRRRSSYRPAEAAASAAASAGGKGSLTSRAMRATLLFLLGVGYGVIVTRLHNEQQYLADLAEGIIKPGTNWKYLAFWGVSGVLLGALLPWFDRVWEDSFGGEPVDDPVVIVDADGSADKELGPGTDWALVMRAIGAFVGIIFAIRKLPWASSFQVSATLALVNPLLWWLIDRSKPGFVLSAGVGLVGSILLLGVNPDMMPAPSSRLSSPLDHAGQNASADADVTGAGAAADHAAQQVLLLGGLARQETIETGVWMLSVLFCSCLCFGNIGRRLAWSRGAGGRGRWGGVR
ncbi:calmodulin A [Purpureocillium lavendulum]|uniref:Calmodulin A n=1 Tax=Purpureocillium lavendulum TaxID=1247861 RepID=A0AB34FZJ5_9HYPO|nr:calmodulin A [Purpureocillium lavendulum]